MPEHGAAVPDPLEYHPVPGFAPDARRASAEAEIRLLYQHLREAKSELQMLSAEMVAAQELERKRIATELHDSVGSSIGSVCFGVDAALKQVRRAVPDNQDLIHLLELLSAQTRAALDEVRRISHGLRPASLDDLGLIATLSWMMREFRAVHTSITLVADIALEEGDIQPALRTPMFRIVQEALSNAVKHAKASRIAISLFRAGNEICLEIADDGVGFDIQQAKNAESAAGMGLRGMADRITISGGYFRLNSAPGKGTRVLACWPLASMEAVDEEDCEPRVIRKAGKKAAS